MSLYGLVDHSLSKRGRIRCVTKSSAKSQISVYRTATIDLLVAVEGMLSDQQTHPPGTPSFQTTKVSYQTLPCLLQTLETTIDYTRSLLHRLQCKFLTMIEGPTVAQNISLFTPCSKACSRPLRPALLSCIPCPCQLCIMHRHV